MRKSVVLRAALLIVVVMALGSCTFFSDVLGINRFTVDGEAYPVGQLWVDYYGSNGNGSYDVDFVLASDGLDYYSGGRGDYIYLDLNSPSSSLDNGTYTWSSERSAFTIVSGFAFMGYDSNAATLDDAVLITGGTVTFRAELIGGDQIFRLDLRGENLDGNSVDVGGYFRGPIDEEWFGSSLSVAPRFDSELAPLFEKKK